MASTPVAEAPLVIAGMWLLPVPSLEAGTDYVLRWIGPDGTVEEQAFTAYGRGLTHLMRGIPMR